MGDKDARNKLIEHKEFISEYFICYFCTRQPLYRIFKILENKTYSKKQEKIRLSVDRPTRLEYFIRCFCTRRPLYRIFNHLQDATTQPHSPLIQLKQVSKQLKVQEYLHLLQMHILTVIRNKQ